MKKGIYRLKFDCGRSGELNGIFVDTDVRVQKAIECGVHVYFGEVLGKHSEVTGPIEENDIQLITENENAVSVFEEHNLQTGFNPFNHSHIGFEQEEDDLTEKETLGDVVDYLLSKN